MDTVHGSSPLFSPHRTAQRAPHVLRNVNVIRLSLLILQIISKHSFTK